MKTYNFKYGHGSVSLSLNEADILAELHGTETPPIASGSAPEIGWRW